VLDNEKGDLIMCKWTMMREASEARKAADQALIDAALGTGLVTKAPIGMRNVTPANMERIIRGQAIVESGVEAGAQ
jgi:hypothetical protein